MIGKIDSGSKMKIYENNKTAENDWFFLKVRENDTRKMTSCTRKTSNVASYIRFTEFEYAYIDWTVLRVITAIS